MQSVRGFAAFIAGVILAVISLVVASLISGLSALQGSPDTVWSFLGTWLACFTLAVLGARAWARMGKTSFNPLKYVQSLTLRRLGLDVRNLAVTLVLKLPLVERTWLKFKRLFIQRE